MGGGGGGGGRVDPVSLRVDWGRLYPDSRVRAFELLTHPVIYDKMLCELYLKQ